MNRNLLKALVFNGRYAAETEKEAALRRANERRQAAEAIEQQAEDIERLRRLLGGVTATLTYALTDMTGKECDTLKTATGSSLSVGHILVMCRKELAILDKEEMK